MSTTRFHHGRPLTVGLAAALALCLLLPGGASAAEAVGRVLVAAGGVTAEQEGASARGLGRRDRIFTGDTIRTASRGRVQIRFSDGGVVDLEPNSTFEVNEYRGGEGDGNVVMSFLRGAMRTITGAIGGDDGENYRMNTSVATLGVRGTAYALHYCDRRCQEGGGRQGLYGRVDGGAVTTADGATLFGPGEYFFIPDGGAPRRIVVPPDGILDGDDDGGEGGEEGGIEDVRLSGLESGTDDTEGLGGNDTDLLDPDFEAGDDTEIDPPAQDTRPGSSVDAAFSGAFLGSSGFAVFESPGDGDVRIDDQGRIVGAEFEGFGFLDASGLTFNGEGTTTVPDPIEKTALFDVTWGSWSADSLPVEEGEPVGFIYAFADPQRFTQPDQLAELTGFAQYDDLGGPPAIASDGSSWQVDHLAARFDFTDATVDTARIRLINGGTTITVDGGIEAPAVGSIDSDGAFSAAGLTGGITEGPDYEGDLSGRFLGQNAEGALVAFEVREVDGERRIVGSQVLGEVLN